MAMKHAHIAKTKPQSEKEKSYESYRCDGEAASLLQSADELGICCGNPVATKLWDSSYCGFQGRGRWSGHRPRHLRRVGYTEPVAERTDCERSNVWKGCRMQTG